MMVPRWARATLGLLASFALSAMVVQVFSFCRMAAGMAAFVCLLVEHRYSNGLSDAFAGFSGPSKQRWSRNAARPCL